MAEIKSTNRIMIYGLTWIMVISAAVTDCPPLQQFSNGSITTDGGFATYQNATYSCDPGYNLIGGFTRTCQENGTWSGDEPSCEIKECPALLTPANGNVSTSNGLTVGEIAYYYCVYGFDLIGNSSRLCDVDGNWTGSAPICEKNKCNGLLSPQNGNITTPNGLTVGEFAYYDCVYGFELIGNSRRRCDLDGNWTGSEPTCEEIGCPNITAPRNGSVTISGTTAGHTANFSCDPDYQLKGDANRTCLIDGTWSGSDTICNIKGIKSFSRVSTKHEGYLKHEKQLLGKKIALG